MGRYIDLKKHLNIHIKNNRSGSLSKKKLRQYSLIKFLEALNENKDLPLYWSLIRTKHISNCIELWREQSHSEKTIYLIVSEIREYLNTLYKHIENIDNIKLGLKQQRKDIEKPKYVDEIHSKLTSESSKLVFEIQSKLGLTLSEAFRFNPWTDVDKNKIIVPRNISFNKKDRVFFLSFDEQNNLLSSLKIYLKNDYYLTNYSKQLKITYKNDMRNNNYNSSLNYRYFYAQHRLKMLTISHGRHEAFNLIKKEMGVTSIRAVRGFVNG